MAVEDIEDIGKISRTDVISASRRTDIPAFFMKQVIEAMKEGFIKSASRFNRESIISLDPKDVKCIVWWSKDYHNWLEEYQNHKKLFKKFQQTNLFSINDSEMDFITKQLESNNNPNLEYDEIIYDETEKCYYFLTHIYNKDLKIFEQLGCTKFNQKLSDFYFQNKLKCWIHCTNYYRKINRKLIE